MSESEAPIKLPSAPVVKQLFAEANRVKEETSSIAGSFGDRIKTQIEIGNLHGPAFRQASSVFRKARNNELKAKEHLYHLRAYLDWVEEDLVNKGHVGNLVEMAKESDASEETEDAGLNAAPTAEGGVPLGDALAQFEGTKEVAARRRAGRKKLDLPEDGSAAVTAEAAVPNDDVPPAPSPDDFGDDIRPAFLRQKEQEREADQASVH